jgi:hypothetical protein
MRRYVFKYFWGFCVETEGLGILDVETICPVRIYVNWGLKDFLMSEYMSGEGFFIDFMGEAYTKFLQEFQIEPQHQYK